MTINEQVKILDNKIRSNQAQCGLDRQNAKISALSSGELDKYEYLTGENFGYKPDVVQKSEFEYSPSGQVFNKGLKKDEKQEGLLKRLKNIEGKTEQQLDLIRDQGDRQLDLIGKISADKIKPIEFFDKKNTETKEVAEKINKAIKKIKRIKNKKDDNPKFTYYSSDRSADYIDIYTDLNGFGEDIYNGLISLDEAKRQQIKILSKINKLKNHNVKSEKNKNFKEGVLKNLNVPYNARLDIIEGFENKIFLINPDANNISKQIDATDEESDTEDSKSDEKSKILEWVYISDYDFNKLKDEIDNAVNKNLGPILNKEKINY